MNYELTKILFIAYGYGLCDVFKEKYSEDTRNSKELSKEFVDEVKKFLEEINKDIKDFPAISAKVLTLAGLLFAIFVQSRQNR